MGKMDFKVTGDKEFSDYIDRYSKQTDEGVKNVVNKAGLNIQSKTRKNMTTQGSVDKGHARSSVRTNVSDGGYSVVVGSQLEYFKYLEFGTGIYAEHPYIPGRQTPWFYPDEDGNLIRTRGMRARPSLIPAYNSEIQDFQKALKDEVRRDP